MDIKIELGYDKTKPKSIEAYAQKLIGRSFRQVMEDDSNAIREDGTTYGKSDVAETKRNKGNVGQIIEECFFHYS